MSGSPSNPTPTDICERLRNAIEADGPNRSFLEELKAHVEVKEKRIVALEAKCALLTASLSQEEKRSAELEAQITSANDAWMELYGALTKRYEALEAQLKERGEPMAILEVSGMYRNVIVAVLASAKRLPDGKHALYAHPPAEASSDYVLSLLVTAGHVSQEKVDEAREIARKTPGVAAASNPVAIVKADHDGTKHAILRDETVADGTLLYAGRPLDEAGSEWVSVDDKLPPVDEHVLLSGWFYGDPNEGRWILTGALEKDGSISIEGGGTNDIAKPTHWMTLPAEPAAIASEKEQPK
jgi:hypothetical protein